MTMTSNLYTHLKVNRKHKLKSTIHLAKKMGFNRFLEMWLARNRLYCTWQAHPILDGMIIKRARCDSGTFRNTEILHTISCTMLMKTRNSGKM